jgi:hypothetical protein
VAPRLGIKKAMQAIAGKWLHKTQFQAAVSLYRHLSQAVSSMPAIQTYGSA